MQKQDIYFLQEAFRVARELSQDANTQTGAVIVNRIGRMISVGSNRMHYGLQQRFEKGMSENLRVTLSRPEKYASLTHAERDAIYYASRVGIGHMLNGGTLYTTWTPCVTYAEVIINTGIKRVVTHKYCDEWYSQKMDNTQRVNWDKSIKSALDLMERCGVQYECLDTPIGGIEINFDDKIRKT